jgi:hypothetical protein
MPVNCPIKMDYYICKPVSKAAIELAIQEAVPG